MKVARGSGGYRARGAALVAVFVLTAGCGPRDVPADPSAEVPRGTAAASSTPAGADGPSAVDPSRAPTADATGTASEPSVAAGSKSPRPTVTSGYGPQHNNGAVRISLSDDCVSPGSVLVITIAASRRAGLGMVVAFSDGDPHGAMHAGGADDAGRFVWRVPIAPTVPDGEARVLVTATGPDGEQEGGGTTDEVFRVDRADC